jgi:His/Glu/Gln/Arg/opine family amino acid ABC transporter permease subunit
MDNQPEEKKLDKASVVVNYDDPPRRSAPSLSVGPVGWVRENLFGSPLDAILTILSVVVIVSVTVTVTTWAVQQANWLTINQNFRSFMAGTYPITSIWRLAFLVNLAGFMTGFTIATHSRVSREFLITVGVILAALFAVPVVANATLPAPATYLSAGVVDVQSGTVTETPTDRFAFVGRGGTTIQITVPDTITDDEQARELAGFMDRPMQAYFNAALNRNEDVLRLEEITKTLNAHQRSGATLLTCTQFLDLKAEKLNLYEALAPLAVNEEEVAALEVDSEVLLSCEAFLTLPETEYREITGIYDINSATVNVMLLDAEGASLGEATLTPGEGELTAQLPTDGWYVVEAVVDAEDVMMVLDARNIYPLIERSVVDPVLDEDGEPIVDEATGRLQRETIAEYVNVYRRTVITDERVTLTDADGEEAEVGLLRLTDTQYAGERPTADYVMLGLVPTLDLMGMSSLWFVVFGALGYVAAVGIRRAAPVVPGGGITPTTNLLGWLLAAYLLFLLSLGIDSLGSIGLGNIVAMLVWVGVAFFVGATYNSFDNKQLRQGLLGITVIGILLHVIAFQVLAGEPSLVYNQYVPSAEDGPVVVNVGDYFAYRDAVGTVLEAETATALENNTTPPLQAEIERRTSLEVNGETVFPVRAEGYLTQMGFYVQLVLWGAIVIMMINMGLSNEDTLPLGARRRGLVGAVVLWVGVYALVPLVINLLAGAGVMTQFRSDRLLPVAEMRLWGGFLLTFMLTIVGIIASFPIGILLALGRRAHRYPAIKYFCILYIEFVRGVPLITVLFMASLLVPLVNPELATVPQVVRAMVGITMFSAAYLAENVRGGLQSIPSGQEEAGKALGLNNVQVTMQITLPQALRAVIPALVGQAISLFKDTSLVYIVGLADLTGVAIRVVAQSEFVGRRLETLVFISVIYFIFSYVMSFVSRRIEESGSGSARRS